MRTRQLLTITLTFLLVLAVGASGYANRIEFWMQNYDNLPIQSKCMNELIAEFKKETGITVDIEYVNWDEAMNRWTLVATGGAAPDAGDMYWLYTFSDMGGGKYGPMPLDEYVDQLGLDGFFPSSLADVTYKGHVYGVPWRIDIRLMAYRTDYFAEAGLTEAPQTWEDLLNYAQKLTKRTSDGRVERYGLALRNNIDVQQVLPWVWQAGGEIMSSDGKIAQFDTPEFKEAMQFVRDLIYKYEVVSPFITDPSYNEVDEFRANRAAMIDHVGPSLKRDLELTAPQLVPVLAGAPPVGHKARHAYSGAGYFGVLYGTKNVEAAVKWVSFLARPDVQLRLGQAMRQYPPNRTAAMDPYYTGDPWGASVIETLQYAHTSQHPSPAYSQIMAKGPGGVMFDLWQAVIHNQEPLEEILKTAQVRAQELMDRVR
ncbi:MAG TPA: extracellular solute-binding protein [Firmicutes bacterium]|nr:extracellular solute-binding protein [Bacillota bacterium]